MGMRRHHTKQHGESLVYETKECGICGDEFEAYKERRKYCSTECNGEAQRGKTGEDAANWQGGPAELECEVCGEIFTDRKAHADDRRTCSLECRGELQSQERIGENAANWQGGRSRDVYHGTWYDNRRKALERDGYECRACGMSREAHKEKYDRDLEVHHVVPVKQFDDPLDAHSLGNLVTACRKCHNEYEGLPIFPR